MWIGLGHFVFLLVQAIMKQDVLAIAIVQFADQPVQLLGSLRLLRGLLGMWWLWLWRGPSGREYVEGVLLFRTLLSGLSGRLLWGL